MEWNAPGPLLGNCSKQQLSSYASLKIQVNKVDSGKESFSVAE